MKPSNFDAAVVYFLDSTGDYFVAKHFYGISPESMKRLRKLPTDFIGGTVVRDGKTIVTEDLVQFYNKRPQLEEYKSLLSVPIKVRKETIGVLDVFTREHREFSSEDISLIESIGLQIGVASENAKLFEPIDAVTTKLRELVQLNQRLSSCLDQAYLIHLLTSELGRVFKAKVMFVTITNDRHVRVQTQGRYDGLLLRYDDSIKFGCFNKNPTSSIIMSLS
ncbi:GAF domain-containing protein [Brevibacillus composti]|uniref:GAF domain-containing protein n=1 Tax=Brevibacillus composti TaxID=2796470 RepID=A0A7T5JM24_9BACL|nr:GAF domain-containing protein [Brevibacillus composti]QQE72659.1 GAF domain-containing protein [Brevibacillus composti]QUO39737.1 GAF domain-containing protein [Brevibacillus composti]